MEKMQPGFETYSDRLKIENVKITYASLHYFSIIPHCLQPNQTSKAYSLLSL